MIMWCDEYNERLLDDRWMSDANYDDFWRYYDDVASAFMAYLFMMVASIPLCGLKFLMFMTAPIVEVMA